MLTLSTGLRDTLLNKAASGGGGWAEILTNCTIVIYDGTMPVDADTTEGAAVEIVQITESGGNFTPGSATNGLNFGQVAAGIAYMALAEVWSGEVGVSGTPTWFRIYDNDMVLGDSVTEIRADGTIGLLGSGEDMEIDSTVFNATKQVEITNVTLTLPA